MFFFFAKLFKLPCRYLFEKPSEMEVLTQPPLEPVKC